MQSITVKGSSFVARVARRLISTEQSVGVIACETGFANANHYCQVFRQ
jgi:transcriptional regulator GlxA family with amidase domain